MLSPKVACNSCYAKGYLMRREHFNFGAQRVGGEMPPPPQIDAEVNAAKAIGNKRRPFDVSAR
jgi:hypothetical protein